MKLAYEILVDEAIRQIQEDKKKQKDKKEKIKGALR